MFPLACVSNFVTFPPGSSSLKSRKSSMVFNRSSVLQDTKALSVWTARHGPPPYQTPSTMVITRGSRSDFFFVDLNFMEDWWRRWTVMEKRKLTMQPSVPSRFSHGWKTVQSFRGPYRIQSEKFLSSRVSTDGFSFERKTMMPSTNNLHETLQTITLSHFYKNKLCRTFWTMDKPFSARAIWSSTTSCNVIHCFFFVHRNKVTFLVNSVLHTPGVHRLRNNTIYFRCDRIVSRAFGGKVMNSNNLNYTFSSHVRDEKSQFKYLSTSKR